MKENYDFWLFSSLYSLNILKKRFLIFFWLWNESFYVKNFEFLRDSES